LGKVKGQGHISRDLDKLPGAVQNIRRLRPGRAASNVLKTVSNIPSSEIAGERK
jgi:hypothetical protein